MSGNNSTPAAGKKNNPAASPAASSSPASAQSAPASTTPPRPRKKAVRVERPIRLEVQKLVHTVELDKDGKVIMNEDGTPKITRLETWEQCLTIPEAEEGQPKNTTAVAEDFSDSKSALKAANASGTYRVVQECAKAKIETQTKVVASVISRLF